MSGERILMVAPYPPLRDGIAAYAVQEVKRLAAAGHDVEVLSPGPSAAHHHLDLLGPRGPLALARRVRAYDRVIVQFHPDLFYPVPAGAGAHAATSAGLAAALGLAHSSEVRVHEVDYAMGDAPAPMGPAMRAMWRRAGRVVVHTEAERDAFVRAFRLPEDRVAVADHGAAFTRRTDLDQAAARARLGLPAEPVLFLSIGFIQPHKGFDRALRAFAAAGLGPPEHRIDVVGSVRVEETGYVSHLDELVALAETTPGAAVHPGYVSDEQFDLWLVASDVVVLPYRRIWSSGVMERAELYGRPVIASRVGGLADQAQVGTVLVEDDAELIAALRAVAAERAGHGAPATRGGPWPVDPLRRDALQAEIRARAAHERGMPAPDLLPRASGPSRDLASLLGAGAPLRRLAPLKPAPPVSGRPGSSSVKRLVQRLTGWQVDPVVDHVNVLQRSLVDVADALAAEVSRRERHP